MKKKKEIEAIFKTYNGIARAKELLEEEVSYYQLKQLMEEGRVIKIQRGLYQWGNRPAPEMVEVARIVPKGIFCLLSAAAHYELTTFVSSEYHLAVPKKYKIVLPEYPPIKLYYWLQDRYDLGVQQVSIEGQTVNMYDMEKTVCDIIRYQKKVGLDTMKEVLHTYLAKKNRNLDQMGKYADILGMKEEVFDLINLLV